MPSNDQFKKQQEAQLKAFEAMQAKQQAKMEADRKAYEARMKQWAAQAPAKQAAAPAAK